MVVQWTYFVKCVKCDAIYVFLCDVYFSFAQCNSVFIYIHVYEFLSLHVCICVHVVTYLFMCTHMCIYVSSVTHVLLHFIYV